MSEKLKDEALSVAHLPEDFKITDPFAPEFLLGLPKEALVTIIVRAKDTYRELQDKYDKLTHLL